jgi:hypothetical protein
MTEQKAWNGLVNAGECWFIIAKDQAMLSSLSQMIRGRVAESEVVRDACDHFSRLPETCVTENNERMLHLSAVQRVVSRLFETYSFYIVYRQASLTQRSFPS